MIPDKRLKYLEYKNNARLAYAGKSVVIKSDNTYTYNAHTHVLGKSFTFFSGGRQPLGTSHRKSAALTKFKALYPFSARNEEELSFETGDTIEVLPETFFFFFYCVVIYNLLS